MKCKQIPFISFEDLIATKKDWVWELGDFHIVIFYSENFDDYVFRCIYTGTELIDIFENNFIIPASNLTALRYSEITRIIQERYNDMVYNYLKYFEKCDMCEGQS